MGTGENGHDGEGEKNQKRKRGLFLFHLHFMGEGMFSNTGAVHRSGPNQYMHNIPLETVFLARPVRCPGQLRQLPQAVGAHLMTPSRPSPGTWFGKRRGEESKEEKWRRGHG